MIRQFLLAGLLAAGIATPAAADDLVQTIEQDLAALGYDTGPVDGESTLQTQIAISQFQADHGLEVTGEASPQLAGVIKSKLNEPQSASAPAAAAMTEEQKRAAEQACIERKIAEAKKKQEQKKGLTSLFNSVSRAAGRYGGSSDVMRDVSETTRDISDANATVNDFEQTAKDLGISDDEIESCRQ